MEWNALEANWKQVCSSLQEKWSNVTDEDLQFVDKSKDGLIAKVHSRTGLDRDIVERRIDALVGALVPQHQSPPEPVARALQFPTPDGVLAETKESANPAGSSPS